MQSLKWIVAPIQPGWPSRAPEQTKNRLIWELPFLSLTRHDSVGLLSFGMDMLNVQTKPKWRGVRELNPFRLIDSEAYEAVLPTPHKISKCLPDAGQPLAAHLNAHFTEHPAKALSVVRMGTRKIKII